jgi:LPS-assembly protein
VNKILVKWLLMGGMAIALTLFMVIDYTMAHAETLISESIQACIIERNLYLTDAVRTQVAQCLGWETNPNIPVCLGSYHPLSVTPSFSPDELQVMADKAFFYQNKPSLLSGNVEIRQNQRVVNAETAYVYRDPKSNQIKKIEFLDGVRYLEPDKLMIAKKAIINPQDKSGTIEEVLYRFNMNKRHALLPAWGRARLVTRYPNADYILHKTTYTTCAPHDKAWDLEASSISINNKKAIGVARNVKLRIHDWPVLYTPYLSFPTSKERKSGFLMPVGGYSNIGGFDFGIPYYLNLAPNYDLTLFPHAYSERGVMLGAEYRYLTPKSYGLISGSFLPHDAAYRNFLNGHEAFFPWLRNNSTNRWSLGFLETTQFTPNLRFHVNAEQVSDDYYYQDFSTNLALITQRQLLRQADLTYTTEHWVFRGMAQSYQTLHPINETLISNQYERLPQLLGRGYYYDLPFHVDLNIIGQYDQFFWPGTKWSGAEGGIPQGPRFHVNPVLFLSERKPWGYITPSVEFVENYYEVKNRWGPKHTDYNRFIPRYSVRGGLFFDRNFTFFDEPYTQTLEPSVFYLRVPFKDQSEIPIYDTANMIFNVDQLFRTNRFSGFDRIGDANQLSYALTTRWLSERTGSERANFSIGQIKYFSPRRVQLCRSFFGPCLGSAYEIGQLSPFSGTSPIASRAAYHLNPKWEVTGDYVWDTERASTNNAGLNLRYEPGVNAIINFGYSYLFNGDVTAVRNNFLENNALHQGLIAFSWPFKDRWSALGAYSHNISKRYSMMSLLGVQYDNCCWAIRILGGRTFRNLNSFYEPQYNNNIYLQILLKGLGSVANSDPGGILRTYIPGYNDQFH